MRSSGVLWAKSLRMAPICRSYPATRRAAFLLLAEPFKAGNGNHPGVTPEILECQRGIVDHAAAEWSHDDKSHSPVPALGLYHIHVSFFARRATWAP